MIAQSSSSIVHNARPPRISRSSFASSGRSGARTSTDVSGERKEHILKTATGKTGFRTKIVERADAANVAIDKQHDAIADSLGVDQLVNGENKRAPVRRNLTEQSHDLAR